MAQRYEETENYPSVLQQPEALLIEIDFRPQPNKAEIMRLIGEKAVLGWNEELNAEILSSEPVYKIEGLDGNITVTFKQYQREYMGDTAGIPHPQGSTGLETIRVLKAQWDKDSRSINTQFVDVRNLRTQLIEIEAKKHTGKAETEIQNLRRELWGDTKANVS